MWARPVCKYVLATTTKPPAHSPGSAPTFPPVPFLPHEPDPLASRPLNRFRAWGWALLVLAGCRAQATPPVRESNRAPDAIHPEDEHAGGRPVVVRKSSVVVFWLPASDTLDHDTAADLLDDFRSYTDRTSAFFANQGIEMVGTNSDTIYVELKGGPRRTIVLSGLDFPFGYVLIEPGIPEWILTGISTDEELLDAATDYFDLDAEDRGDHQSTVEWR